MVTLYSADRTQLSRLKSALPPEEHTVATDDWHRFQDESRAAECAVVAIEWLDDHNALHRLSSFKKLLPLQPLILVTHRDADNVRRLKDVPVEEIIWPEEIDRSLDRSVKRARTRSLLRRLAREFGSAAAMPGYLRHALAYACTSEVPVTSVIDLAASVGCNRRTLSRQWHESFGASTALRLEDVVHWLLLLRTIGRKLPSCGWSAVAAELHVHEHTLARAARRLTGRNLGQLYAEEPPPLLLLFRRQIVEPLLGPASDILG